VNHSSYESVTEFSQTKPSRPNRCKPIVAKPAHVCLCDFESDILNEIAERLHIPRIKMVIRLLPIVTAVSPFFFIRDKQEQFAVWVKYAFDPFQNLGRIIRMLKHMMANHYVDRPSSYRSNILDKLYAVTGKHGL
jgi:hypothetical protein